jgi:SAM-dependent methyltransferase
VELLLGCGSSRERRIAVNGRTRWTELVTLDFVEDHDPDVVHDLEQLPYPFADDTFQEIHAYEVLEHLGRQGDFRSLLRQFEELWRILKPGGVLAATSPSWRSMWAWGDPGHTRVITSGTLVFLSQAEYARQIGVTAMSDYRPWYRADFQPVHVQEDADHIVYVLQAIKPVRTFPPVDSSAR